MLESISWQEFISATALLICGYYVITTLLLYGSEITNIFKQRSQSFNTSNVRGNERDSNEHFAIVGPVRYAPSQAQSPLIEDKVLAESLHVVAAKEPESPIIQGISDDDAVTNSVAALLDEINTLIEVVAVGNKEECSEFFRTLLSNYSDLYHTAHETEITLLIYNSCKQHCEFEVELHEVKSWWPHRESTAANNQ